MLTIGDVVERDSDGARYRLTGVYGRSWMAERIEGPFEGAVKLTPRALAGYHLPEGQTDVLTPQARAEAGEPAFDEGMRPASPFGWAIARQLDEQARAAAPGAWALADAHRQQRIEAARQQQLDEQHEAVHDNG